MADGKEVEIRSKFDATGIESGVAQAKASVQSLGPAAKQTGAEASKALDGAFTQSIKRVGEATAEASKETMTWVQFVKANMGPAMRQFSAEGVAHSEAHTKAIRQIAEQWKIYKATGIDANKSVAQSVAESAAGLNASQSRSLEGIKRQVIGLTEGRAALLSYRAAQAGIAAEAAPFIAKAAAVEKGLTGIGMSARETAFAIRGVPAQLTDIFTSLASGQRPMMVLLQQGGQLKDMFGGIGPAARALGGYLVGLVNPFTIAAAAAVGLFMAYKQGSAESEAYNKALILTGNAAGTTADKLGEMAKRIGAANGTVGGAAAALAEMAGSTKIAEGNLERFASVAVRMEKLIGQPIAETRKQFEELGKAPVEASLKLNEQYNFLTASVYRQIKALEDQGRASEAAALAQTTFADAMKSRTDGLEQNLGIIERSWNAITGAAKGAWDAMLNVGRGSTGTDELAALETRINAARTRASGGFGASVSRGADAEVQMLTLQRDALREALSLQEDGVRAAQSKNKQEQAYIEWLKTGDKFLSDRQKMEREIAQERQRGLAAGVAEAEIEKRIAVIRESHAKKGGAGRGDSAAAREARELAAATAEAFGLTRDYTAQLGRYQKLREQNVLTEEEYVRAVEQLIAKQPFARDLTREEAEATKALEQAKQAALKANLSAIDARQKDAAASRDAVSRLAQEAERYGLTAEQVAELVLQRELHADAIKRERLEVELATTTSQAEAIAIQEQIKALDEETEARKRVAQAAADKRTRDANADAAKEAAREWERTADKIEQALANALMDGGKSGLDYIKGIFRTAVLQPILRPVSNAITGAVQGFMGGPAGAASAAASGSSMFSGAGALSGIGAFGSGFSSGLSAWQAGGSVSGLLGSGSSLFAGGLANGLGTIAGALAPIGVGIALIASLMKDGGGPKVGGSSVATIVGDVMTQMERERLYTPTAADATLLMTTTSLAQQVNVLAQRFGGNSSGVRFGLGFDTDPLGTAPNRISAFAGDFSVTNRDLGRDAGSIERGIAEELIRLTLAGLQASNLTDGFADLFNRLDPATASPDAINNLISLAESLRQVGEQAKYLPGAMGQVANLSATAREALVNLAGGFDALIANQASFAANFLTPVERVRSDEQAIGAEFKRITGAELSGFTSGKTADEIRTTFKQLVLGIDLTTEHGPAAYAALLALNAPMAKFITDLESVGGTLPAVESAADKIKRLTGEIETLDSALADILQTAEQSPLDKLRATVSLRDSIQGAREGIAGTIQETTLSGFKARGDTAGAVAFLKSIENDLWSKLGTALDDGSTAQKIVEAFSRRMGLEAELTAADVSVESLRTQISLLEAMQRSAESIRDTLLELTTGSLSALSPQDQLAASRAAFESTLTKARGGDAQAVADLAGSGRGFLAEAQSFFGSGGDFANIFRLVTGSLAEFGTFDPAALVAAQDQLKNAESVATDNSGTTIAGLTEIDTRFGAAVDVLNTSQADQVAALRAANQILIEQRDEARAEYEKTQIRTEATNAELVGLRAEVAGLRKDLAVA